MSVAAVTLGGMVSELPYTLRYLARNQSGVVSRSQAIRAGLTSDTIRFRVTSGRWQQIHRGVYATFTGVPGRGTQLWAAVLSAGRGAALSHETAAELHGLIDDPAQLIHVTVPFQRHAITAVGISLHRSRRAVAAVQESGYPPRTTVQQTVLDLTQTAPTFDDVCGWVTRAFARRLTDETGLREAMSTRRRLRWRADLDGLITAAGGGDHSVLEFRYHRDVERAHDLPESSRQVAFTRPDGGRGRRDRVYEGYQVVGELDGRRAHPVEAQWKDRARDNAAAAGGQQSLRYSWEHVTRQTCATAVQVAKVLRVHGWEGWPRPCSPGCPVQRDFPAERAKGRDRGRPTEEARGERRFTGP
jgi:hypothetical protein